MRVSRIDLIKDYIMERKTVSLDELCEHFHVSKNTIRRDISVLIERGSVKKVYGGVVANEEDPVHGLISFSERNSQYSAEKNVISKRAASYVENGDTIFLDTGTTTVNMIPYLADKKNLTVITYSLPALVNLLNYENMKVICLPGQLLHGTASFVGSETSEYLSAFNISKAFMACTGIHPKYQVSNATFEEYSIKKTVMAHSHQHYLLADSHKFGQGGIITYANVSEFDVVITEAQPSAEYRELFNEARVELDVGM